MIDFNSVVTTENIRKQIYFEFDDTEDVSDLIEMFNDAKEWLEQHRWVTRILNGFIGITLKNYVGVFLFEIESEESDVDQWTWVVYGDLPPAYITSVFASNPLEAINGYVGEMECWVDAVKFGGEMDKLIPVNVTPTLEYAEMLNDRLNFLRKKIIDEFLNDEN